MMWCINLWLLPLAGIRMFNFIITTSDRCGSGGSSGVIVAVPLVIDAIFVYVCGRGSVPSGLRGRGRQCDGEFASVLVSALFHIYSSSC